jgi:L-asparaginase type II
MRTLAVVIASLLHVRLHFADHRSAERVPPGETMSRVPALSLAAFAALLVTVPVANAQDSLPAVHVIATGGTISNTGGDRLTGEELVKSLPGIERVARVTVEQFTNVASGSITYANWRDLALRINELYRTRPELRGIVVTHGTDTMEETAYFLDLTVASCHPVIVTGAMRQATAIGADGPANLFDAISTAAAPTAAGRGTMVLLNDEIFAARDVTKIHTTRPDAFDAPTRGPLGDATRRVEFYHPPERTNCNAAQFPVSATMTFPRVDIVVAYLGADSVMVQSLMDAGAKGIVVAGAGAGATTPAQGAALRRAREKGIAIVTASRTGSGSVGSVGGRGQAGQGGAQLNAGDLTPQKARIRLMLALSQSSDPAEVARLFTER